MSWAEVPLHKVADLESGFGFPRDRQGDPNQEFPFFRVSDMNLAGNEVLMANHTNTVSRDTLAVLHARAFPPGTVIFPKIGAAIATEKKRILTKPATYDNNVMGAVPKGGIIPQFLYYWFLRLSLSDFASASHVPSIRKSVMEEIPFSLPPPSEQRRIVEILDQADALRKLRREADAKAARILPTLFLKMFGDPATNPMGWPAIMLGDVLTSVRNGTTAPQNRSGRGLPVTRIETISDGVINEKRVRYVELTTPEVEKWRLSTGDILFSHINSETHIGKTALYSGHPGTLIHGMNLLALTPDQSCVAPIYLHTLLTMPAAREYYRSRCKRAVNQASLNQRDVGSLATPIPPLQLQQRFARAASAVTTQVEAAGDAGTAVDAIFNLILRRAFSGQLTAKWHQAHMEELLIEMQEQARLLNLPAPN